MKKFLFDTNSLSSLLKRHDVHHKKLTSKIKNFDFLDEEIKIYASILSIFEMEYGVAHATTPKLIEEARTAIKFLKDQNAKKDIKGEEVMIELLPLTIRQAEIFGEIKEQFQKEKTEIGEKIGKRSLPKHNIDLIIAATTIEHGAILVSNDQKMFEFLQKICPDFKWEDWTK
ncbi:type II toxin-antitoxin system VapC family toxin [Candidatus Parabeggiatoa sp. HSG14]|uniref:type II toxin-antitoxin system VapC family toxin n=1 Tax=Candidatus Parabeggiatoa sp. HSG14 TaxID=3055593 RepID=UPI0025A768A2|nr:type II toxin-antitoxin system VapC family toxin [Thiotrichales bacterium HSG14]